MAYKKSEVIEASLKAIQENNLIWIGEIFAYVPFTEVTFYRKKCQECKEIKKAIEDNRVKQKQKLRKKWYDSENSTLQVAAYKLLSTEEERDILNTQKIDHSNKGEKFDFNNIPTDELVSRINKLINSKKPGKES